MEDCCGGQESVPHDWEARHARHEVVKIIDQTCIDPATMRKGMIPAITTDRSGEPKVNDITKAAVMVIAF